MDKNLFKRAIQSYELVLGPGIDHLGGVGGLIASLSFYQ